MTTKTVGRITFDVMGTEAEVIVSGGPSARFLEETALDAQLLLEKLERRWSRFLPDSDVSRLNASAGEPTAVHWSTRDLLLLAVACWRRTGGRFDPTIGAALVEAGYDRTFAALPREGRASGRARIAPGCAAIDIEPNACVVTLGDELTLDLGGIGKGYAADLAVAQILAAGASGACVNVGGDVRVGGIAPTGEWIVALANPERPDVPLGSVRLIDGAIAMSGVTLRTWRTDRGEHHHVIDPRNGGSSDTGVVGAVVVAGSGWWADALTKVLLVSPVDQALDVLAEVGSGALGLVVQQGGLVRHRRDLHHFLAEPLKGSVQVYPDFEARA